MYLLELKETIFLPEYGVDFSLPIGRGELHVLVGPNGIGKSTLVRQLSFRYPSLISLVEQRGPDFFYDRQLNRLKKIYLSARKDLISPETFHELWKMFGLHAKEDRHLSYLSGGERQSLKLCLGLSVQRELYVLDEPSQFLDANNRDHLWQTLEKILASGKSIIVIDHQLDWIKGKTEIHQLVCEGKFLVRRKSGI